MNTDTVGPELKRLADRWPTPTFDPATIAALSGHRASRARRRTIVVVTLAVLIAGVAATLVSTVGSPRSTSKATPEAGTAPAMPPPVRITALGKTLGATDGAPVLARIRTGQLATIRARLYFEHGLPGRVHGVALVIARPGTAAGASPDTADSYYRTNRVAISAKVAAASPQQRVLTVTTPTDLPAGNYPVLTVINSDLLPAQQPGIRGPFVMSSELGVIVISH